LAATTAEAAEAHITTQEPPEAQGRRLYWLMLLHTAPTMAEVEAEAGTIVMPAALAATPAAVAAGAKPQPPAAMD